MTNLFSVCWHITTHAVLQIDDLSNTFSSRDLGGRDLTADELDTHAAVACTPDGRSFIASGADEILPKWA
jgi:hypothetical protein